MSDCDCGAPRCERDGCQDKPTPVRDRRGESNKDLLADALRRYPTWGDAWLDARDLLLDIEGTIVAYWTDIPEAELERLRLRIRKVADGE